MIRIFKEAYDVLHAYMVGKSRKNALYFAKYIDFFQTQFTQKVNSVSVVSLYQRTLQYTLFTYVKLLDNVNYKN